VADRHDRPRPDDSAAPFAGLIRDRADGDELTRGSPVNTLGGAFGGGFPMTLRTALFQTALSGLVAGTLAACGGSTTTETPPAEPTTTTEPAPATDATTAATAPTEGTQAVTLPAHECKTMNECSGQGGCKVEGQNDCKGKNPCKGKGGCKTV
jgi:hypothetical protein